MKRFVNHFSALEKASRIRAALVALSVFFSLWAVEVQSAEDLETLPEISADEFSLEVISAAFQAEEESTTLPKPAVAEEDQEDIDSRLKALEEDFSSLQEDYESLQGQYDSISGRFKTLVVSGHDEATMEVSGRIHADHWAFPRDSPGVNAFETGDPTITPQDRIGFRRMRFGVQGAIWKNMVYKIEMEFAGGNDVEFRDVFLGFVDVPILQELLIGNQKRPYGLDHINSSRYNVFIERPFIIEAFNQDARRFGIQSYGHSEDLVWNWRYGVFNQRLIQDEGIYISDHYQSEFASRLATTFWYDEASDGRGYGHFAVSSTFANPDGSDIPGRATNEARFRHRPEARSTNRWLDTGIIDGANDYQLVGVENVWNFGPVQIVGEYLNLFLQRDADPELHLHGGYVYFAYFLTGEHMPWDRETGQLDRIVPFENFFLVNTCRSGIRGGKGAWQIAYRYSYGDLTDNDILGGVGRSHTFGLNWYWNPYGRMQFNVIHGEIDEHEPVAGFTAGDYTILGTRLMVDF